MDATLIVAAAGSGERLGADEPKAFVALGGVPLLVLAIRAARASEVIGRAVVAAPADAVERGRALLADLGDVEVVAGGDTRQASVASALSLVDPAGADVVVCHDAARPFAAPATFRAVVEALRRWDGAVPGLRIADTVKRVDGERVVATEPRESLVLVQTPQAFRAAALVDAHRRAVADGRVFSDDAGCLESAGYTVGVVPGDPSNFKITDRDDLRRATSILETAGG